MGRLLTHDELAPRAAVLGGLLQAGEHSESGEMRNESLRYFAAAWNAVLEDMRMGDLLSNHEQRLLVFRSWSGPLIPGAPSVGALEPP